MGIEHGEAVACCQVRGDEVAYKRALAHAGDTEDGRVVVAVGRGEKESFVVDGRVADGN